MRAELAASGHCYGCRERLDPRRSRARIIGGRIVSICHQCAGVQMPAGLRPGESVDTTTEWLGQMHLNPAPAPSSTGPRMWPWLALALVASSVGAYRVGHQYLNRDITRATAPAPNPQQTPPRIYERTIEQGAWSSLDMVPATAPGQWIHPLAAAAQQTPDFDSRLFGAARPGNRPRECRRGHCGVDLIGPRGTLVVAVAAGEVTRVQRSSGSRSGKYVRIIHDDDSGTSYMHLDEVAPGLEEGMRVEAGQLLGTLGRTGIKRSVPHLHFSLDIARGEHRRYIDPLSFLEQSQVIDIIDVRFPLEGERPTGAIATRETASASDADKGPMDADSPVEDSLPDLANQTP